MCLILNKDKVTPKYTTKDKVVYKWLVNKNGKIMAPIMNFDYKMNILYESELLNNRKYYTLDSKYLLNNPHAIVPHHGFIVDMGTLKYTIKTINSYIQIDSTEIENGFHVFNTISDAMVYKTSNIGCSYLNISLFKCIIPKHSWYYENEVSGEVASDHLIVTRKVEMAEWI